MDKYVATGILFALIAMVVIQVIMRTVFSQPLIGPEEVGKYFNICIVFLAAPYAARTGSHIRMREVLRLMPVRVQHIVTLCYMLSAVAVFGTIAAASVLTTIANRGNVTPTVQMPFAVFFLPTMVGFIWLTAEYLVLLVRHVRDRHTPPE